MDNKLLKRVEFIRKFLEYYGLYWKVKVIKEYAEESAVLYVPMYKKYKINCNSIVTNINNTESDLNIITNDRDISLYLSHKLLILFLNYYDKTDPKQVNLNKIIRQYFKLNNTLFIILSDYENIDFEYLIECLILDGVPLDKFPSIEEVI